MGCGLTHRIVETHHTDEAERQAWTQMGPHGLRPNWSGPSFWCHGSTTSRGVAILLSPSADISHVALRHHAEDGRALSIDFSFTGGTFTAISVYAPCVPAQRAAYYTQLPLPSLPADRQLLVGGDFFFFFFVLGKALHVSQTCHRSNISGQLEKTSGMKAYTARPTTGEAALPWQAIRV